jgi:hypothetical protein
MRLLMQVASAAFFVAFFAAGAAAQMTHCMPRDTMVGKLKTDFDEDQVGIGLSKGGVSVVELYVSETLSWTVIITRTNGVACIAASGTDWHSFDPVNGKVAFVQ